MIEPDGRLRNLGTKGFHGFCNPTCPEEEDDGKYGDYENNHQNKQFLYHRSQSIEV